MKKLIILSFLLLAFFLVSQDTFAYTFFNDSNIIATDSPYTITYSEEPYDVDYRFVHIKLAPGNGHTFAGNYVMNLTNIFSDPRLADFDTTYQVGESGGFPIFDSAAKITHYNSSNTALQIYKIAYNVTNPQNVTVNFNTAATPTDYYVITVLLDTAINASSYLNTVRDTENGFLITMSFIPFMEGATYVSDVDHPKTIAQIRTEINLTAIDSDDGDITDDIIIYDDNYTGYESTIGIYDVVFYVEDSAGNGVYATLIIVVMDTVSPTVPGTQSITRSYTQVFDFMTFINGLAISDNYDDYEDLTITIVSNTYTGNEDTAGSYQIIYRVTDQSENFTDGTINIQVNDLDAPAITGPDSLSRSQVETLSISEIVAMYTAADAHDGDLTPGIYVHSDTYTGKVVVGTYTVILRVVDSSGNIGSKTINVSIVDEISPIFFIENNGKIIHVSGLASLSENDIVDILVARGFINLTPESEVIFAVNNYELNAQTSGTYAMMLNIYDEPESPVFRSYGFAMIVYADDLDPLIPTPDDETGSNWFYDNQAYIYAGLAISIIAILYFKKRG